MKHCNKCNVTKDFSEFHKSKNTHDGVSPHCKSCKKEYNKKYYLKNKEELSEQKKKWYYDNHDRVLEQKKNYYSDNRELIISKVQDYRDNNKDKISTLKSKYQKENRHKTGRLGADKRARKRSRTPKWLTKDQKEQTNNFYWLAQDLRSFTGQDYHVDHIVPLAGKNVCGLHVPWNLQVLPSDINISKGCKYEV